MFSTAERPKISPWSFRDSGSARHQRRGSFEGFCRACRLRRSGRFLARCGSRRRSRARAQFGPHRRAGDANDLSSASNDAFATPAASRFSTVSRTKRLPPEAASAETSSSGGRPSIPSTSVASVSSTVGDVRITLPSRRTVTVSAKLEHLAQEVGDEHDRSLPFGQRTHDLVELGRLGSTERPEGSSMTMIRASRERARRIGFLLLGRSQAPGARVAREGRPASRQDPRMPDGGPAANEAVAPRLGAEVRSPRL